MPATSFRGLCIRRDNRLLAAFAVTMLALLGPTGTAGAADDPLPPSADEGQVLADKFCKGCHIVESGVSDIVPAGPPPFHSIAIRPDQTVERIRNVLIKPHAPMPDMSLSNAEILNLIAYIDKLRTEAGLPAMLPPPDTKKPKYPSPS